MAKILAPISPRFADNPAMRPSHPVLPLLTAVVLTAAMLAIGCGENGDDVPAEPAPGASGLPVELSSDRVSPGETFEARVRNEGDETFTYGQAYELEREVDGSFQPVDIGERAVIQIAHVVEPGELGAPVPVVVPDDAQPGRWRVIVQPAVPDVGDVAAEFVVIDD